MSTFPTLKAGSVSQYPTVRELCREATVLQFIDGTEQRYRANAKTARRWVIQLDDLDEDELAALEHLFEEAQGRSGSFSFRDPQDGIVYEDCSFEDDDLLAEWRGEGRCRTEVIITENRS